MRAARFGALSLGTMLALPSSATIDWADVDRIERGAKAPVRGRRPHAQGRSGIDRWARRRHCAHGRRGRWVLETAGVVTGLGLVVALIGVGLTVADPTSVTQLGPKGAPPARDAYRRTASWLELSSVESAAPKPTSLQLFTRSF